MESNQNHFTIFYLLVLTTVPDYRQVIPDYPAIHESMCLVWLEIRLGYLQGGQTVLEQYIDGAAAVNQHSVKLNLVDTRIED